MLYPYPPMHSMPDWTTSTAMVLAKHLANEESCAEGKQSLPDPAAAQASARATCSPAHCERRGGRGGEGGTGGLVGDGGHRGVDEHASGSQLQLHVGQPELHGLELNQRLAELLSGLDILQHVVQRRLGLAAVASVKRPMAPVDPRSEHFALCPVMCISVPGREA